MPALDPLIVPVLEPEIVPVLEPLIVPVRDPVMVPTREPLVRDPGIVPAEVIVVSDNVKRVANETRLRVFILILLANSLFAGPSGMALRLGSFISIPFFEITKFALPNLKTYATNIRRLAN